MREQQPPRRKAEPSRRTLFARAGWAFRVLLPASLALSGCYDQILDPAIESDSRLTISNDEAELSRRLRYLDQIIAITGTPSPSGPAMVGPARAPSSVSLRLVAELDPPNVSGRTVQATSISATSSTSVLISYNTQGAVRSGAVDRMINFFGVFPRITSSVQFSDADINGVALDGSYLYVAEATDAAGFASPAVLERLTMTFFGIRLEANARAPLTSFAGTSVLATPGAIYATSGDTGDVFAFNPGDLNTPLGQYSLDDARWVAHDAANGRIVVVQGTPGRISVFSEGQFPGGSMNLLNTFPFPGADVAESKSTVAIAGGKAFIAAGPAGVQVMCLDNGQIVGTVPRPDPASLGLDPSVVVTNAVAVDGDLMFISNGEAGVYVAAGAQAWNATACSAQQSITTLGQLQFGSLQSVNHVFYQNGTLMVAAGLGGLKIVAVTVTP